MCGCARHLVVVRVSSQFGAFLYGVCHFGACQFGTSQYDAIPVRRVSLWRDASLARVTLTRFSFLLLSCMCHSDAFLIFMLIQYTILFL